MKKNNDETEQNNTDKEIVGNEELQSDFKQYTNSTKTIKNYGGNHIKKIKDVQLEKYNFQNLTLKECSIEDSEIKYSYICDKSYLRHTRFKNVDFTGTIFENVNLQKASFENCLLNYVRFENCIIDYENILKSKPYQPNLALFLIKSLYKNELQQGNTKKADELLLLLKKEERELYKSFLGWRKEKESNDVLYQNVNYYNEEMERRKLSKKCVFFKLMLSYINDIVWGYGIKVSKIFRFMCCCIFIFAGVYLWTLDQSIFEAFFLSANSWILNSASTDNLIVDFFILIENYLGLVSFALYTSALYRKVEK